MERVMDEENDCDHGVKGNEVDSVRGKSREVVV